MKKICLIFHTVKYLRWPQLYFRIYRKLVKPKDPKTSIKYLPERSCRWFHQSLYEEKITGQNVATFLNSSRQLILPKDWNNELCSKLWLYNLHYFEDVLAIGADKKYDFHIELLDKWIAQNPFGCGNGWEPYPISLRIPNVLKAWLAGLPLKKNHFESLHTQASFLSNSLEKHLLGNHYFVNLKAMLFAGIIFNDEQFLRIAISGLVKEIPEQILADGGHFELTPMYHSLILVDMLDMYNLIQAYPGKVKNKDLFHLIENYIIKMLYFMNVMTHNDGGLSFFNDSVDGIAPTKKCIQSYAKALGFETSNFNSEKLEIIDLFACGYIIATLNDNKLIFDAANIGPDYLPGHAHADTLCFELSIGNERVFVNTGISQYAGERRIIERKTRAHNTVEVDGKDSSQVWSNFRVAKRARILERKFYKKDGSAVLYATHDGYKKIDNGPLHTRRLVFSDNYLLVDDNLLGSFTKAVARFYFHPELNVSIQDDKLFVYGKYFKLQADLEGKEVQIIDTLWHPGFGLSKANKCLEVFFSGAKNSVKFTWVREK